MSKRVMVVDDDMFNCKTVEFILKTVGYEIVIANSGEECLALLDQAKKNKRHIDLILLDIEMPVMNGLRTLEAIRAKMEYTGLPVIFLTAKAEATNVLEASKLRASGFIRKPCMPEDLLDRVENVFLENYFD